jgi:hypothetical protein
MTIAANIAAALGAMNTALGEACTYDAGGTPVAGTAVWSVQTAEDLRGAGENYALRVAQIIAPKATFATVTPGKTFTRTADSLVYTVSRSQPPTDMGNGFWQIVATARVETARGIL